MLIALAGCRSPEEKAAIAEARYDAYFSGQDYFRARVEIRNAIRAEEDVPGYWVKLARVELLTGNMAGAYSAYSRVVELQPDNVEALQYTAQLLMASGDFEGAKKQLDALMVLVPNDTRGRLIGGTIAAKQGHADEALRIANAVIGESPTIDDAWILKAMALEVLGRVPEAISALEQRFQAGGNTVAILQKLLDLYKARDDIAGIRNTYVRLFRLQPTDTALQLEFARVLYGRGRIGEAQALVGRLQREHGNDSQIQLDVIRFWRDTEGPAVALAELDKIAAHGNLQIKAALAGYSLDAGEPVTAKRIVAPFVGGPVTAGNVGAHLVFAAADKELGRSREARQRLDRILAFDETNSRALLLRTQLELRARELDAALTDVRVLVRDNPDLEEGRLLLAQVYAARGEHTLADAAFKQCVSDFPASPATLEAYTTYLASRRDLASAARVAANFTRSSPGSVPGWRRAAEICVQAGDVACAGSAIERLAKLPGGQAPAASLAAVTEQRRRMGEMLPQDMVGVVNGIVAGRTPIAEVVQALVSSGRADVARKVTALVLKRDPGNSLARVVQANLIMIGGEEARGRIMLRDVIANDRTQARAYRDLALSLMRAGDAPGAFAALDEGLKALPGNLDLMGSLAGMQVVAGRPADAMASYRRILAARPQDLDAVNNLVALIADSRAGPAQMQEGLQLAGRLKARDLPAYNDTRGWMLHRAGRSREAVPLIARAAAQAPGVPVFAYHLGAARIASGDQAGGIKLVQQALAAAGHKDPWLAEARMLLARS